jgi:hypothetical protein
MDGYNAAKEIESVSDQESATGQLAECYSLLGDYSMHLSTRK